MQKKKKKDETEIPKKGDFYCWAKDLMNSIVLLQSFLSSGGNVGAVHGCLL